MGSSKTMWRSWARACRWKWGKWEGGRQGVLFIRSRFLACATRSPRRFYLQFEACMFFSWDLWKISWVGDKLVALVGTPYELGDRVLGGSCEMDYGAVTQCGAGGLGTTRGWSRARWSATGGAQQAAAGARGWDQVTGLSWVRHRG
jgi:hypothetical protein